MEDWQQRVIEERDQLKDRTSALQRYMDETPYYSNLHFLDQKLLMKQRVFMEAYLDILNKRIKRFKEQG